MQRAFVSCLILLGAASIAAQDNPLPRYKVVKGVPWKGAVASMNEAADQGYRLLIPGKMTIMRLDAAPPDTYRYLPFPDSGGTSSLLNALNQQGAFGYKWLNGAELLEKEPHPHNYEYRIIEGITPRRIQASWNGLQDQGFRPVGKHGGRPMLVRKFGQIPSVVHRHKVRSVDTNRKGTFHKKISELAAKGYRYSPHEVSLEGAFRSVSMEECDSSCRGPFEYRVLDVHDIEQAEQDLNSMGKDGFHLLPDTLAWGPYLAERPADHKDSFAYRVIQADDEAALEKSLNESDREGFVPIGFVTHIGWNIHVFAVLEKATAAATP